MRLNADTTHPDYDKYESRWEFYARSYLGGEDYFNGAYLTRYISETSDDYDRRLCACTFQVACLDTEAQTSNPIFTAWMRDVICHYHRSSLRQDLMST